VAVRREDLFPGPDAVVVAFPTELVRAQARRRDLVVRRRRAVGMLAAVVVSLFLLATDPIPEASGSRPAPRAVTLGTGESLWDLAVDYAPTGSDPRAYVAEIRELNDLWGTPIAGVSLRLPR
jgi:hypothetical protein